MVAHLLQLLVVLLLCPVVWLALVLAWFVL